MKILVADDYKKSRDELTGILKKNGHDVVAAVDGVKALELYKKEPVEICFIDWDMPGMGGIELCKKIREEDFLTSHVSYQILVSGKNVARNLVEGMDAGARDFIMKPYSKDIVLSRIVIARKILEATSTNLPDAAPSIEVDSEPVKILKEEHKLIHRMTGILEIVANMLDEGVPLPKKMIKWAGSSVFLLNWELHESKEYYYIEVFIDRAKMVHGKTNQLFTRSSLTQIMREHEIIKNLLTDIQASANKYDEDRRKSVIRLKIDISRYLTMIRFHAAREEDVFLPFTQRYFTEGDIASITENFQKVEDDIGIDRIDARTETIRQLEKILQIKDKDKY